jgi:hypothetical protein
MYAKQTEEGGCGREGAAVDPEGMDDLYFAGSKANPSYGVRPVTPNPSLHRTCYGWLRQPPHAGEL